MPANKNTRVKSALILRLEIKRFGRVDRYYIDAKESSAAEWYGFKEPYKATPFKSIAEIRKVIDANTSKRCNFEILHVLDYQQLLAS